MSYVSFARRAIEVDPIAGPGSFTLQAGAITPYDPGDTDAALNLLFPATPTHCMNVAAKRINTKRTSVAFDPNGSQVEVPLPEASIITTDPFKLHRPLEYCEWVFEEGSPGVWRLTNRSDGRTPMQWIFDGWQPGLVANRGDATYQGNWNAVARRRTTDQLAPFPKGDPYWMSGLGDTPAWEELTVSTTALLMTGQLYTLQADDGYHLARYRVWIPEVNPLVDYRLVRIDDPLGNPIWTTLWPSIPHDSVGWQYFNAGGVIFIPGQQVALAVFPEADAGTPTFNGYYDYKRSSGSPGEGEIYHQGNGWECRIHYTDENSVDLETELRSLEAGHRMSGGGLEWDILNTDERADHTRLTLDPAVRIGSEDKYTFTWTQPSATPMKYVRIQDHYSANVEVEGFYVDDGFEPGELVRDQHAYGLDIELTDLGVSPDWEIMSYFNLPGQ